MGWYQRRVHGERKDRRSSCSLGDSESGYQAPPCYKLQTFLFFNFPNSKTNQPVKMAMSKIRQNYHEDCEALINKQINMEFYASYVYHSMSSFFNRDDQALHGFADHFKKESNEERAHGMKSRSTRPRGAVALSSRTSPSRPRWTGAALWKPWRPRSSLRRRSTRACSTSTRWPGTRATVTCATSSSPST